MLKCLILVVKVLSLAWISEDLHLDFGEARRFGGGGG